MRRISSRKSIIAVSTNVPANTASTAERKRQSEIARERAGDHGACPISALVRWAMRSMIAVMALAMKAGGSMMTPREIAR